MTTNLAVMIPVAVAGFVCIVAVAVGFIIYICIRRRRKQARRSIFYEHSGTQKQAGEQGEAFSQFENSWYRSSTSDGKRSIRDIASKALSPINLSSNDGHQRLPSRDGEEYSRDTHDSRNSVRGSGFLEPPTPTTVSSGDHSTFRGSKGAQGRYAISVNESLPSRRDTLHVIRELVQQEINSQMPAPYQPALVQDKSSFNNFNFDFNKNSARRSKKSSISNVTPPRASANVRLAKRNSDLSGSLREPYAVDSLKSKSTNDLNFYDPERTPTRQTFFLDNRSSVTSNSRCTISTITTEVPPDARSGLASPTSQRDTVRNSRATYLSNISDISSAYSIRQAYAVPATTSIQRPKSAWLLHNQSPPEPLPGPRSLRVSPSNSRPGSINSRSMYIDSDSDIPPVPEVYVMAAK